jgi:hypothetical protein
MVSGLFAGLFGTGGPPVLAVFAHLALDKDVARGFLAVPAGFMCEYFTLEALCLGVTVM